jgi:NAD+ diphosphatase
MNLKSPTVQIIPVWRNHNLIFAQNDHTLTPKPAILSGEAAGFVRENAQTLVFLGIENECIYWAADISHLEDPRSINLPNGSSFEDLRRIATAIDPIEAGYLAYARALIYWHVSHQYCGICGSKTKVGRGGHVRSCLNTKCGKVHFPRTDPAVIMLVTHPSENKCLLGHNKKFQGLRFSTIAGFVEPGEMLEQAVAREVFEETNIQVVDVTYKASQPWPFPASIMLGFRASATTTEIICHDQELAEANWFSRAEVKKMATDHEMLPPTNLSISRWLIDDWLSEV